MTQSLVDVIFESAPTEASEEEQLAWCEEQMTELCGALENERENKSSNMLGNNSSAKGMYNIHCTDATMTNDGTAHVACLLFARSNQKTSRR